MADRGTLHPSSLDDFLLFLRSCGLEPMGPGGDYQVAQVRMPDGVRHALYKRLRTDHVTVPGPLVGYLRDYMEVR